jgi:hypothetical protein
VADCRLLELPKVTDQRGSLGFAEAGKDIPFGIRRIYYLYDVPTAAQRGGHAHKALHQVLIALHGAVDVTLDDGKDTRTFRLNRPDLGLYVCPMIWRDLSHFSAGAICLVLASEVYDEADYYRDYGVFQSVCSG